MSTNAGLSATSGFFQPTLPGGSLDMPAGVRDIGGLGETVARAVAKPPSPGGKQKVIIPENGTVVEGMSRGPETAGASVNTIKE